MVRFLLGLAFLIPCKAIAAGGAQLTGLKGNLKQIEKALYSAVSKAEELYEQNGGDDLSGTGISILDSASNPFLLVLDIRQDYTIRLQFNGTSGTAYDASGAPAPLLLNIPLAQVLYGKKIKLVPIFVDGESRINSWECVTNADKDAKPYLGSMPESTVGNTSLISLNGNSGKNEYLSNCVYVSDLDLW